MDANTTTNHERVTQVRTENQKWQLAPTWLSFMVLCSSPLWLEESMRVRGAEVACGSQGAATPSAQPLALFLLTTSYRQAKVPPSHGLIIFYKHFLFNSSHPTTHIHSSLVLLGCWPYSSAPALLRSVSSSTCLPLCNRTPCSNAQRLCFSWPTCPAIWRFSC